MFQWCLNDVCMRSESWLDCVGMMSEACSDDVLLSFWCCCLFCVAVFYFKRSILCVLVLEIISRSPEKYVFFWHHLVLTISVKLFSHYAFWHAKLFFSDWCFAIVSPFLFHQTQSWLVIVVHLSVIRLWPLGDGFATWFSHGSGTHSQRIRSDTKTIGWSPFEWFSSTRRDCVSTFHMFPYSLFCLIFIRIVIVWPLLFCNISYFVVFNFS